MNKRLSTFLLPLLLLGSSLLGQAQSDGLAPLPASAHQLVVIAHRGHHATVPENSLAAVEEAIRSGADYVELDLRTSRDGQLVIHHDETLARLTGHSGKVSELTLAELRALQLRGTAGQVHRIPEYKEALKACKGRINLYLDFKEADVAEAWRQIREAGMEKQVVVYLTKPAYYKQWRSLAPQLPLMTSLLPDVKTEDQLRFFMSQVKVEVLDNVTDPALVRVAQQNGVAVWLDVQSPTEGPALWQEAVQKGVRGVQTDQPDRLVKYLNDNKLRDGLAQSTLAAAPAKPTYRSLTDVRYGPAEGKDNLLDAHLPQTITPKTRVIMYMHGGSWNRGDKSEFPKLLIDELVGKRGYIVVSMNYRLVRDGQNRFPAQIEDVQKAVAFLTKNAARYGYNGSEIALMGGSAGAHLAMLYAFGHDKDRQVKAVVDLWGPTDLSDKMVRADGSDADRTVIQFLGEADPKAQICLDASPTYHLTKETGVPTILFHGQQDPLVHVSQAENLYQKLVSLGIPAQLELYPNEKHGMSPAAAVDVFAKMISWLGKYYPAE
jgi:glycerophosphoryl diester phosphodiesterase